MKKEANMLDKAEAAMKKAIKKVVAQHKKRWKTSFSVGKWEG